MGESKYIPEELYEAFFERYFEYGEDAAKENAIKAVKLLKHAYKAAEQVSESAENGELFDEAEAVLAFQTLSLSYYYLEKFMEDLIDADVALIRESLKSFMV